MHSSRETGRPLWLNIFCRTAVPWSLIWSFCTVRAIECHARELAENQNDRMTHQAGAHDLRPWQAA